MIREILCVMCPAGCRLKVLENAAGKDFVTGQRCARGKAFGLSELQSPSRIFTTTVRVEGGLAPVVSVRSSAPIPRGKLIRCSATLAGMLIKAPVASGDVILRDVMGTGASIIATSGSDSCSWTGGPPAS